MSATKNNSYETRLRNALRNMDGDQYQTIREAYYKAAEGLRALAETLERAAPPEGEFTDALIIEHMIACSAIDTMNNSHLGRIV